MTIRPASQPCAYTSKSPSGLPYQASTHPAPLAAGAELLGVAWSYRDEGTENVWLAEIPATGAALIAGQQITTGTSLQRDPVLAANGAGWMIAWYGNPDGDFDVYAQGWEAGRIVTGGSRQRLTMRAGRDDAPALLALPAGGAMAGWVETRGATMSERVPVLRPLSAIAEPTAAQRDGASSTGVPSFVLAPRSGGLSLAYVQSGSAMPDALLQPLDASGAPVGAPITLSTEHNADGSVDVAADAGGGAVVFGTTVGGLRPEVRARLIDGSGMLQSGTSERVITVAPASGRDATIAPLAGGYVIAYRALGATPTVRLDFRDAELAPTVTLDVASASASGGRVTVRVSGEGRMIVGWADVDATAGTTAIRAARVRCD